MRGYALMHSLMYFVGLHEAYSSVTAEELALLKECARGNEVVVELGVFEGRTSRALREVIHPSGTLWLVDPFLAGRLGISWQYQIAKAEVRKARNGTARILRQTSLDAGAAWEVPYDLLFIDADHSYDAVRKDWEMWSPFAKRGGLVAFHDSCCMASRCKPDDGPVRLVEEISKADDGFELIRQVHSLSVLRRL